MEACPPLLLHLEPPVSLIFLSPPLMALNELICITDVSMTSLTTSTCTPLRMENLIWANFYLQFESGFLINGFV